jgi:hypothetical protein
MKRKLIILILALTTSLSVFSGLASLLTTGPNSTETAPISVAEAGPNIKPPVKPPVGPPPPGPSPNGGSWGG